MRRLALFCLLVLAGPVAAASLDREELRVGLGADDPPFAFVSDTGEAAGFEVDLVRALCARLQVRCTFSPTYAPDVLPQLQGHGVDLVPGLTITEARSREMGFTEPYYRAPSRFIVRRGKALDPSAAGLRGTVVGVERGSVQDRYVSATYPAATMRRYDDRTELYLDLALDRLDTVLTDAVAARVQFLSTDLGADFDFVGPQLDDPEWFGKGVGIAVSKGDDRLRTALNGALQAIRGDGTLDAIASLYFPFPLDGT